MDLSDMAKMSSADVEFEIIRIKFDSSIDINSLCIIYEFLSMIFGEIIRDDINPDISIYNRLDVDINNDDKSFKVYFRYSDINDLTLDNKFYSDTYKEFRRHNNEKMITQYKKVGYSQRRRCYLGDLNLMKFDVIICNNIETYNYFLNERVINFDDYKKFKSLFVNFKSIKNNIIDIETESIFVIPSIGRESLNNSIDSIMKQNNNNWKIIVVFDNKNDEYLSYSDKYKDNTKITFLNKIDVKSINNSDGHGRASEVRNFALDFIKSNNPNPNNFICFLDDDDTISSNYIDRINEELFLNPDFDCIIFRMIHENFIVPRINDHNFYKCEVGISFTFRCKLIIDDNISFEPGSITEDFNILDDIRNKGYKIIISPYLTYFVMRDTRYSNLKFGRSIINDDKYKKSLVLNIKFKAFIINLHQDIDRMFNIRKELIEVVNFSNFERFDAIQPDLETVLNCPLVDINKLWQFKSLDNQNDVKYIIGAAGCKLSHYELLQQIMLDDNDYKYYIIFEDDCTFVNEFKLLETIEYIEEHNIFFNILYLSCNFHSNKDFDVISDCLLKCKKGTGFTTHAMVFNKNTIHNILYAIESNHVEIDNVYANFVDERYVMYPMCCYQRKCQSRISVFRELENGIMLGKNETDDIFYGNFANKKFIDDKVKLSLES